MLRAHLQLREQRARAVAAAAARARAAPKRVSPMPPVARPAVAAVAAVAAVEVEVEVEVEAAGTSWWLAPPTAPMPSTPRCGGPAAWTGRWGLARMCVVRVSVLVSVSVSVYVMTRACAHAAGHGLPASGGHTAHGSEATWACSTPAEALSVSTAAGRATHVPRRPSLARCCWRSLTWPRGSRSSGQIRFGPDSWR
jgi:hypothetical protein